ncbi:MAG: DUF1592 domain-containing protein [Verrucomicrobiota bacterium]
MPPAFPKIRLSPLPVAAVAVALLSAVITRALLHADWNPPSAAGQASAVPPKPAGPGMPDHFLKTWCFDCHGDGAARGGLSLDDPAGLSARSWENIRRHVLLHTMPPEGKPAPAHAEREDFESALISWQASLPDAAGEPGAPARESAPFPSRPSPLRRLSRSECARSLEALLGVSAASVLTDLPGDESAHGFDNNGDMQPLPPGRLESYLAALSGAVGAALLPPPVPVRSQRVLPGDFRGDGGLFPDAPEFHMTTSGKEVRVKFHIPAAGRYRWSMVVYAHQAGDGPALLRLADSPPLTVWRYDRENPQRRSAMLNLPAGDNVLAYRLANPLTDSANPDPHRRMRRLLVRETSLEGPLDGDATPVPHFAEILGPVPAPQASMDEKLGPADAALTKFARRAWRRPVTAGESLRLLSLTGNSLANGLRYDEAMAGTVKAILASPNFLFLTDPASCPPDLRAYASAARLSYFLTSRPPDDALLTACAAVTAAGGGWAPDDLADEARRMLDSGQAEAFAEDFAGQWLQLRNTALASPDKTLFPQAAPALRAAMLEESTRFFLSLIRENAPVLSLLTADHTFLNGRLAAFYGLPFPAPAPGQDPAENQEFARVNLPSPQRRGLLGQASVLMLTSYPNRTSPVLRGKYILETLLGLEPPPPPPNVPTLEPAAAHSPGPHSVRAALERHRADPGCASCHRAIDPLGFPLETWDAIGRPVSENDLSTPPVTALTGEILAGPADLNRWLVTVQGGRIVHHAAERLLTYALGRGLTPREKETARQLADQAGGRDARFRDLILAVVRSAAFRGEKSSP